MKKILAALICILCAALLAPPVFAQFQSDDGAGLNLSGEAKTGLYWRQKQDEGKEAEDPYVRLHSMDDAGGEGHQFRFRMNMDYESASGVGFKLRMQWQDEFQAPGWSYGFGYGNFFENQLTVAVGKLGASPWGTGGPEMWAELETTRGGGMRVEWKPNFVPTGDLNVGFVLNFFDGEMESANRTVTFTDLLLETLLGASYTHEKFLARLAVRLDSDKDWVDRGSEVPGAREGIQMLYRFEERALSEYLPGLQIWALGLLKGVGAKKGTDPVTGLDTLTPPSDFKNWLFAEYNPPEMGSLSTPFTAQLRFGYDYYGDPELGTRSVLHVKPTFYWHFFDKLVSAGASFWYGQDFGDGKVHEGSPYYFIEFEPKIQLNFASSYIAFVYNLRRQYLTMYDEARVNGLEPIQQQQRINLRFCIYY